MKTQTIKAFSIIPEWMIIIILLIALLVLCVILFDYIRFKIYPLRCPNCSSTKLTNLVSVDWEPFVGKRCHTCNSDWAPGMVSRSMRKRLIKD